jgi:uncharacterized protein
LDNKPAQSTLKKKLTDDMHQAMKSGEKVKVASLRLLLASINNAEIAKLAELSDSDINGIIAKEIRQRQESIEAFKSGNRPDLVAAEEAEFAILMTYLPKQATREEIVDAAKRIIAEVGAQGQRDKGKVMPKLVSEFKGKADGRVINEVVTELLK